VSARLVAEAIALRLSLPFALRASPLDALLGRLSRPTWRAPLVSVRRALASTEGWVTTARVVPDTCLYRALTRFALLARHGHRAEFVLAVVTDEPDTGHAWVELEGEVFDEALERAYTVTLRASAQGSSATRSSKGPAAAPTVSTTTK